jgi:Cu/Ag efflux protein CusF
VANSRRFLLAIAVALLVPAVPAQAAREFGRGNITAVDWQVMQLEIKTPQGGRLTYKVAPNCSVKFTDRVEEFRNPKLQDLIPPMYIHFAFENQTISEIDVREVGNIPARSSATDRNAASGRDRTASDRTASDRNSSDRNSSDRNSSDRGRLSDRSSSNSGRLSDRELRVRIVRVNERRGTFDADVAGRRQGFRVENNRLLRGFGEGDLVILSLDRRGGDVVTDIRSAGQAGRVTRIDERRGELTIEVGGRESVYPVDSPSLLRRLREGDRVTYEVEERRGRKVIVSIE